MFILATTQTSYWIDDARSGCKLDQISNSKLDGIQILEGQLVELTLSEDPCPVSAQMLLQELEENMDFYADESRLSAALMILTKISASLNVSSTFQTRYVYVPYKAICSNDFREAIHSISIKWSYNETSLSWIMSAYLTISLWSFNDIISRSKELTQMYMRNAPLDGDKSIVNGEKLTLVLWEISFPLTEDATLEFSSLAGGISANKVQTWHLLMI